MGCASEQRLLVIAAVSLAYPSSWNGSQDRLSLYCAIAMATDRAPTTNMMNITNNHTICYKGVFGNIFLAYNLKIGEPLRLVNITIKS